jgi:hypothetical protein
MGPFVGVVEAVCGLLIILGLVTRLASIPLIIIMIVALISTKPPILVGHDVGIFHLAQDIRPYSWGWHYEATRPRHTPPNRVWNGIFAAGDWPAKRGPKTASPRGDRKSETPRAEKWPQKRLLC